MPENPEEERQPEKPKIIVDEDWKSQVHAEKAAAQQAKQKQPVDETSASGAAPPAADESAESPADAADPQAPPASFPLLVTSLATQALASLGMTADPHTGEPQIRLDWAKHFIDMLAVLEEKSQNNLTNEEQQMLTSALHELRMAFVAVQNQQQAASK